MRICILTHTYPKFEGDSTAPFMSCLAQAYADLGHQVFVLTPFVKGLQWPKRNPRVISYKYIWPPKLHLLGYSRSMFADVRLRFSNYFLAPFMFFFGFLALWKLVKKEKIDIIHAHWIVPNGFLAALVCRLTKTPLVVSIPGSDVQVARKNKIFAKMAVFASKIADLVTTNSEDLKQAMVDLGAEPKKFKMIIYGIDKDKMRIDTTQNNQLRKKLELDKNDIIVLAVGRLVYKKGFDILIKAMSEIIKKNPKVKTIIVGDGDLKNDLVNLVKKLKVQQNVIFTGTVPYKELIYYYNLADIFTMPSVSPPPDGLNVCVIDAMACGKPIVATNIAGNPLVVKDGVNGLLIPQKRPDLLAKALLKLFFSKNLREKYGKAGRRLVLQKFTWEKLAQEYLKYFNKIVENNKRALDYSVIVKKILKRKERLKKAKQILFVLKDYLKTDLTKLTCLDIGCSSGVISSYLADHFAEVIGIDIDKKAITLAQKEYKKKNLNFYFQDALKMPFKDNSFDVVVCNQVYNFVPDSRQLMREIYRVLKLGGICFFGARNKYTLIESQYRLPFLSWLPHKIAQIYVRITGKGIVYVGNYLSYWQLKKLCSRFKIHDYTLRVLYDPVKYNFSQLVKYSSIMKIIPLSLLEKFKWLIPNYIWILEKPKNK